jgi:hypothetical protein
MILPWYGVTVLSSSANSVSIVGHRRRKWSRCVGKPLVRNEVVQDRRGEDGGLSCAGLSNTNYVAARHSDWDRLLLDRTGSAVLSFCDRTHDRFAEAEAIERKSMNELSVCALTRPLRAMRRFELSEIGDFGADIIKKVRGDPANIRA